MKEEYVIVSEDFFWTGSKWSTEYPEAKVFTNESEVVRVAGEVEADNIVCNYGTDDEWNYYS